MNKSVYSCYQLCQSFFQKLKYLLMKRDLQFRTIRGGLEVRHLAAILSVSDRLIANRNSKTFKSFCLKVDFVYLLTIQLKLEIVPTREITTKIEKTFLFLVGGRGPIS